MKICEKFGKWRSELLDQPYEDIRNFLIMMNVESRVQERREKARRSSG